MKIITHVTKKCEQAWRPGDDGGPMTIIKLKMTMRIGAGPSCKLARHEGENDAHALTNKKQLKSCGHQKTTMMLMMVVVAGQTGIEYEETIPFKDDQQEGEWEEGKKEK